MDPNEMPAMPCYLPDSTTGLETRAPCGIELGPRRSIGRCARCHNHGIADQIKDEEHRCLFQACECDKCVPFSEHYSILPAERDLKMEQGPYVRRRPTRGRIRSSGTTSPRAHSRAKKLGTRARVPSSRSFQPGLGFCLLRVAAKTGSSRGSAGSERIFLGPFWLHLSAPALRCSSS
ncbi:hypothetical protein R6Z07F_020080 [Ovis aries]